MSPSADTQETAWLARIADGDQLAFEHLFRAYQRRIAAYLYRMTGDAEAAAEATNDVMITVWKQAGNFQGRSKPSTWIFGIARNKGLGQLRSLRAHATEDLTDAPEPADGREGPEETLDREQRNRQLQLALRRLPAEQREAVHLAFFQGMSYQEIAKISGCPVATVKTRVFHAKRKLQPILEEIGLGGERS